MRSINTKEHRKKVSEMKKIQSAASGVPEYDINREGTYRLRISPEYLRRLWKMKQESGKPITILVAEALDCYFKEAMS
jgi:hypothetical protein